MSLLNVPKKTSLSIASVLIAVAFCCECMSLCALICSDEDYDVDDCCCLLTNTIAHKQKDEEYKCTKKYTIEKK